jgi:hypothetical protein
MLFRSGIFTPVSAGGTVLKNWRDIDILTVNASHSGKLRTRGAPDGRSGALFKGFEIASFGNGFSGGNGADAVRAREAIGAERIVRHKATEACEDSARMNREGANSIGFAAPVQFHSKQHICGFRLARLALGLPGAKTLS